MAHPNENYRSDDRRRFGGPGRFGEDRREDEWRGESYGRGPERERGREDWSSRTYVAAGPGDERNFGEGYGRGYREDYDSGRFGGGSGGDYDRGRFARDSRDYNEGYDRDRFGRGDLGRYGMGLEDYGRGNFGRGNFGREDYGRGNFGREDYGRGYGQGNYGQGFGSGNYGARGYGTSGYGTGMGITEERELGRGEFRERWETREGGPSDERGPLDRLRDGARRLMGRGPKSYRRSDERIREDLNDRLMTSWMDAEEVEVQVKEGEVTLTGAVYSRAEKRAIEDLAEEVLGVKEVHNQLRTNRGSSGLVPQPGSATRATGAPGTTPGRGMHS